MIMWSQGQWRSFAKAVGRGGVGLFFVLAGLSKILAYGQTAARMESVGLAPSQLLLPLTIALEMGGGLLVAFGRNAAAPAALALAVFTLTTNAFFHRFWELGEPMRMLELSLFFKNVAIAAALVLIAATVTTPGRSDRA
jgi:putative oxidoreductase